MVAVSVTRLSEVRLVESSGLAVVGMHHGPELVERNAAISGDADREHQQVALWPYGLRPQRQLSDRFTASPVGRVPSARRAPATTPSA